MRSLLLLILSLFVVSANAQSKDSLAFVNANWQTTTLSKGVQLKQFHFTDSSLFGVKQYVSFVAVSKLRKNKFKLVADAHKRVKVSDFIKDKNAIAAVNGNFFDMKNGGAVDFIKVDGIVVNESRKTKTGARDFHQKAAVIIKKGKPYIVKWNGNEDWENMFLQDKNVMLNGPLLRLNNQNEKLDSNAFNNNRHPRTCLGITAKGTVIMMVVDGRNTNAAGMSLAELTKIMSWLGAVNAINFDGGGSSSLWIENEGIVNHPSDNEKWDHEGERTVANALYVTKKNRR